MIAPFMWLFADEIDLLRMLDLAPVQMMITRIHNATQKTMMMSMISTWLSNYGDVLSGFGSPQGFCFGDVSVTGLGKSLGHRGM